LLELLFTLKLYVCSPYIKIGRLENIVDIVQSIDDQEVEDRFAKHLKFTDSSFQKLEQSGVIAANDFSFSISSPTISVPVLRDTEVFRKSSITRKNERRKDIGMNYIGPVGRSVGVLKNKQQAQISNGSSYDNVLVAYREMLREMDSRWQFWWIRKRLERIWPEFEIAGRRVTEDCRNMKGKVKRVRMVLCFIDHNRLVSSW